MTRWVFQDPSQGMESYNLDADKFDSPRDEIGLSNIIGTGHIIGAGCIGQDAIVIMTSPSGQISGKKIANINPNTDSEGDDSFLDVFDI